VKRTTSLILAAALAVPMLSTTMTVQAQPTMADRASAYRLGAFRMIGWHLGPIGAMAKGEMPFDADKAKLNADAIAALSQFPKNGFIDGSSSDDIKTRALPAIWKERGKFDEMMSNFEEAAQGLATAAASGSMDTIKPALGKLGSSCKECHKAYRAKKN